MLVKVPAWKLDCSISVPFSLTSYFTIRFANLLSALFSGVTCVAVLSIKVYFCNTHGIWCSAGCRVEHDATFISFKLNNCKIESALKGKCRVIKLCIITW